MSEFRVRPIAQGDDPAVATLIRTVLPPFIEDVAGTPLEEPEVDAMTAAYAVPGAAYLVLEDGDRLCGGGGFLPLGEGTCELRKLYLYEDVRGHGQGRRLLAALLDAARQAGHRTCVLQTTASMHRAQALYERAGFRRLATPPPGADSHSCCEAWFALDLQDQPVVREG